MRIVQEVKFVVLATYASKGLATGVLLVVIITVIVALVIFIVMSGQTGFIENVALFLSNLLSVKLP